MWLFSFLLFKQKTAYEMRISDWSSDVCSSDLRATGDPYKGINCFWLWLCAEGAGYHSRTWMTYKQSQALGGQVREGERSQIAIRSDERRVGQECVSKCRSRRSQYP